MHVRFDDRNRTLEEALGADLLQRGTTPGHEAATQQGQSGRSAASAHNPRFEVNFRLSLGTGDGDLRKHSPSG
jgi:hypothetical protein